GLRRQRAGDLPYRGDPVGVHRPGPGPPARAARPAGHHALADQVGGHRRAPGQASELTAQAFYQATSGRPRPTAIAVPWDVLAAPAPAGAVPPVPVRAPELDHSAIAQAAGLLLAGARNPMIMEGGGARRAAAQVRELSRRLQAPVVSFRAGRGIIDDDDPFGFTSAAGYRRWADTDVLLGIGTRLE